MRRTKKELNDMREQISQLRADGETAEAARRQQEMVAMRLTLTRGASLLGETNSADGLTAEERAEERCSGRSSHNGSPTAGELSEDYKERALAREAMEARAALKSEGGKQDRRRRLMERLLRYENHYSSGAEGYPPKDPSYSA